MDKRNINAIIVFIFCISLLFCAQKASESMIYIPDATTQVNTNTEETNVITFVDPTIEMVVREKLEQPTCDITQEMILEITELDLGNHEEIETLEDLKWFKNLKVLDLSFCNLDSLDGIQTLHSLEDLSILKNQITNLKPICELTNLFYLNCSYNPIADLSPLSDMTKLEILFAEGCNISDISVLENMSNLDSLYLYNNKITNISALENLSNLSCLDLEDNLISDVSALLNLDDLYFLILTSNKITDIELLKQFDASVYLEFNKNPLPEDDYINYFYPIEEKRIHTTLHRSINNAIPEFSFDVFSYFNLEENSYEVYKITISNEEMTQTVYIPEFTVFGQTRIPESMKATMGLIFEDVNFDGYLDIRLFDTYNGSWREEWIYFVWNPHTYQFESDERLNGIAAISFNKEKQVIYGYEHNTFANYCYFTYRYINDDIVLILLETEDWLVRTDEQFENYLSIALIETKVSEFSGIHHKVYEPNEETGEMIAITDEYIIYELNTNGKELLRIDASSELGKIITNDVYESIN